MKYYKPVAIQRKDRYLVKVDEYAHYHGKGYVVVRDLLGRADFEKIQWWVDDMFAGRIAVKGLEQAPENATLEQLIARIDRSRIHMLHRDDATAEYGLLLPRVLDVIEALIGPDVLALQSMVFFNPPGRGGQGWHQDSFYIRTYPDTLIGAWMALEDVDEKNGCLWVAPGSHAEPIYPPVKHSGGLIHADGSFADLLIAENASHLDDEVNALTKVVRKYDKIVPVPMKAGDVLFFHSHLLHRSYVNRTEDRFRRSYVCHYCNARSWVPWNHGAPFEGDSANYLHILARGKTHLPYAAPAFGTPVDINRSPDDAGGEQVSMMGTEDGMMMRIGSANNQADDH